MKRRIIAGLLFVGSVIAAGETQALPFLSLDPAYQVIGSQGNAFVNLNISGLQTDDPSLLLGAFDLNVTYDPSVLIFLTSAGGWGTALGDVFAGDAITGVDLSTPGVINFNEVSLLENDPTNCVFCLGSYLSDLQGDSFTLATLGFYAYDPLFTGHTQLGLTNAVLADGYGNTIGLGGTSGADIKVPEPGTLALMGLGLSVLILARRRRLRASRNSTSSPRCDKDYEQEYENCGSRSRSFGVYMPERIRVLASYLSAACLFLFASDLSAAPVDCSNGGTCTVNSDHASMSLRYWAPGIVDDGSGYKGKTSGGLTWTYNGVTQLYAQWNWIRLGSDSRESAPDDMNGYFMGELESATQDEDEDTITLVYNNLALIRLEIAYRLAGNPAGQIVTKNVKITNNNPANPQAISWFEYTDLDVDGYDLAWQKNDFINTSVTQLADSWGNASRAVQFQSVNPAMVSQVEVDAFDGRLVSYGGRPNLLDRLVDGEVTNLGGDNFKFSRVGCCIDYIFAAQYDFPNVQNNAYVSTMLVSRAIGDFVRVVGKVRDFTFTTQHPDFQSGAYGLYPGIVSSILGADKKPIYAGQPNLDTTHGQANFDQWYRDVPSVNQSLMLPIFFERGISNNPNVLTYVQDNFFPIDSALFGKEGYSHNYHFTFELHTKFVYGGGERLSYLSDDDLWVFINKNLAVDLGGVHEATAKTINLDALAGMLGLTKGKAYDFDVFFAERQTTQSYLRIDIPQIPTDGDITSDGCVDLADLGSIMSDIRYLPSSHSYNDLNQDGVVNILDARRLVTLFSNWKGEDCRPD